MNVAEICFDLSDRVYFYLFLFIFFIHPVANMKIITIAVMIVIMLCPY